MDVGHINRNGRETLTSLSSCSVAAALSNLYESTSSLETAGLADDGVTPRVRPRLSPVKRYSIIRRM